jgi:thymidine kinase
LIGGEETYKPVCRSCFAKNNNSVSKAEDKNTSNINETTETKKKVI